MKSSYSFSKEPYNTSLEPTFQKRSPLYPRPEMPDARIEAIL
ncbi:MAG: hypothetical protein ACK451_17595 [Pseudanabaena sp.]